MMQDDDHIHSTEQDKTAQREADRLQDAIAGRETGAVVTALSPENAPGALDKKERDERQRLARHVEAILSDQERYDALFNDTMDLLKQAEIAADQHIIDLKNRITAHEEIFAKKLDGVNRVNDGTAEGMIVFKNSNGDIVDKNGERITDQAKIDGIVWRDGAMTYEEYVAGQNKTAELKEALKKVERYRTETLGDARERLTDEENKPDYEEVEEIRDLIQDKASTALSIDIQESPGQVASPSKPQNFSMPVIGAH